MEYWRSDAYSSSILGSGIVNDVIYAIGGFDGQNWLNTVEEYTPIGYGTAPPKIQITSPENETYNKVTLNYTVNRDTEWMGYSLDNQANVTITGETELLNLSQGAHNIILYANDSLGNMGFSNKVFFFFGHDSSKHRDIASSKPILWLHRHPTNL